METTSRIRWRLTIAYISVIFVSMAVVGLYLSYSLERQSHAELRTVLKSHALLVKSELLEEYSQGRLYTNTNSICNDLSRRINARVTILDDTGTLIGDSTQFPFVQDDLPAQKERTISTSTCLSCHSESRHNEFITVSEDLVQNGHKVGEFRISRSLFGIKHASAHSKRFICSTLIVAALLAALVSHWLASGIAKPITRLSLMAKRMADGDLDQQVQIESKDEIGELAQSFNVMAEHLKKTVEELEEQGDKTAKILETMADGIIVTDETGKVVLFNKASERVFGFSADNALNNQFNNLGLHSSLNQMVKESLSTGRLVRTEILLQGKPDKYLNAYSTPVKDRHAQVRGMVLVVHDLSELREQEQSQKDFVANVSHELRTPITAVRVTAEALLSGAKDDPRLLDRFLATLAKESERLSLLIDDLLQIATRDNGRIKAHKSEVSLRDVVDRILVVHKPVIDRKELEISLDVPEDMTAYASERQLEQVIANLIDNAIKYTRHEGSVHISSSEDDSYTSISVKDTGIGIPQTDIARIFERFYRVDKGRSRQLGGTGLGLSIVKDIVDSHQGTISVETQLGEGSTFTILLPKWKPTLDEAQEPLESEQV